MKVSGNHLLWLTVAGLGGFWSLGWYIPNVILSTTMSVFSILIGMTIINQYSAGFYQVVFKGQRSRADDGAHLAAIGIPSIAASIVWGGLYNITWWIAGTPESWVGTPPSNFSRILLIGGCVALFLTPNVEKQRLSIPSVMWLAAILLTAVFSSFLLGAYVGNDVANKLFSSQRLGAVEWKQCPTGELYRPGPVKAVLTSR